MHIQILYAVWMRGCLRSTAREPFSRCGYRPRFNTTWNSFVKDQLEDYLHRSVCSGKLDLRTTQKDVSTGWISAYKKYFGTKKPLELSTSNFRTSQPQNTTVRRMQKRG